ncbi:protein co-occurring with transport system [hydrocarbon metagenome]|uniref:Protein co-occurring with transport system n=1 Tax=hydrocarbon metagenome TaxID=938273 RepID=A0A0W8FWM2_9ZZZZ
MEFPSSLKTIKYSNEFRFKEKGSEFIGFAAPCNSEETAHKILNQKRKEFYDATHNCYAYSIVPGFIKYSDDGEPNGTAGIRILNAIQHFELSNLIVVATRYFGGTKLGVGPLGKAYYNSAYGVLKSSEMILMKNYSIMKIKYDFEHSKTIHHFLNKYNCLIKENGFEKKPTINFLVKPEDKDNFVNDIVNSTRGSSEISMIEKNIFVEVK